MKWLLGISLFLNGILIYLLFKEKNTPAKERVIIETHRENSSAKIDCPPSSPSKVVMSKSTKKKNVKGIEVYERANLEEAVEKKDNARREFMLNELNLSEEDLVILNSIKIDYDKRVNKVLEKLPQDKEMSYEGKLELLKAEEDYLSKLKKFFGRDRWQRYNKFREEYNTQNSSENAPFIYMDL